MTQKTPKQRIKEHLATTEAKEYLKKRSEEIDLEVALNREFNRIFKLCKKTREGQEKSNIFLDKIEFPNDFEDLDIGTKRQNLAIIFFVKNKQGEYILKQGVLPNPEYLRVEKDLDTEYKKAVLDSEISEQVCMTIKVFGGFILQGIPENLRELFKQNCFAETQQEIENLKLITW